MKVIIGLVLGFVLLSICFLYSSERVFAQQDDITKYSGHQQETFVDITDRVHDFTLNHKTNKMYLVSSDKVDIVDIKTLKKIKTITEKGVRNKIAVNTAINRIYVISSDGSNWSVVEIDGSNDQITKKIPVKNVYALWGIRIDASTDKTYLNLAVKKNDERIYSEWSLLDSKTYDITKLQQVNVPTHINNGDDYHNQDVGVVNDCAVNHNFIVQDKKFWNKIQLQTKYQPDICKKLKDTNSFFYVSNNDKKLSKIETDDLIPFSENVDKNIEQTRKKAEEDKLKSEYERVGQPKESAIFASNVVYTKPNKSGAYYSIYGISVDPSGKIYLDFGSFISKYSNEMQFEKRIDRFGSGNFVVDSDGYIYYKHRGAITISDNDGKLLKEWDIPGDETTGETFAVDNQKNIYLFHMTSPKYTVKKYTSDGKLVNTWGGEANFSGEMMDIGPDNNVYVLSGSAQNVLIYAPDGKLIKNYALASGISTAEFHVDKKGNMYLIKRNNEIEKYSNDGRLLAKWTVDNAKSLTFLNENEMGLDVDSQGNVLVITYDKSRSDGNPNNFNRISKYSFLEGNQEQTAAKKAQIQSELIKSIEAEITESHLHFIKEYEKKIEDTKLLIAELEQDKIAILNEIDRANKDYLNAKNEMEAYGYGMVVFSLHGKLKNKDLELSDAYYDLKHAEETRADSIIRHNINFGNMLVDRGLITEDQRKSVVDITTKTLKFEDYLNKKTVKSVTETKKKADDVKEKTTKKQDKKTKKTEKKVDAKKTTEKKKIAKPANKAIKSSDAKTTKTAKTMSDDCSVWASMYAASKDTVNSYVESAYGKEEVSKRLADYVTTDAEVTESIGMANEMAAKLIGSCGYNEKTIRSDFGGFNQNIIDSIEIYKGMAIGTIR